MAPLSVHKAGGGATSGGADLEGDAMQGLANRLVGGDAAGANERRRRADLVAKHLHPGAQPIHHHLAHRLLKRGAKVGDVGVAQRRDFLRFKAQRGFQPRQREVRVRPPNHGTRQRKPFGVALRGLLLDQRSAGIAEAEELGGLVEGFADGVVERAAEAQIIADAAHAENSACGRRTPGTGSKGMASRR